jgi:hypothetical protein
LACFVATQVYLERILRKPEVDAFAEELKPHQVLYLQRVNFDSTHVLVFSRSK